MARSNRPKRGNGKERNNMKTMPDNVRNVEVGSSRNIDGKLCGVHFLKNNYTMYCRMTECVAGSFRPIPVFLHSHTHIFNVSSKGIAVQITAAICPHPRSLQAYAKPGRASARREAPLLYQVY